MPKKTKQVVLNTGKKPVSSSSSMDGMNFMQEDGRFDTRPLQEQVSELRDSATLN